MVIDYQNKFDMLSNINAELPSLRDRFTKIAAFNYKESER